MDNRKQALTDLLFMIEAGDNAGFRKANRAVFSTPCQDMALQLREEHSRHAYNGSLDAAKALHEAVFHERVVAEIKHCVRYDPVVRLWDLASNISESTAPNPARAWLIAIIKALIAKADA